MKNWTEPLKYKASLNFLRSYRTKLLLQRLIKAFIMKIKCLIFENSELKDGLGWIIICRMKRIIFLVLKINYLKPGRQYHHCTSTCCYLEFHHWKQYIFTSFSQTWCLSRLSWYFGFQNFPHSHRHSKCLCPQLKKNIYNKWDLFTL